MQLAEPTYATRRSPDRWTDGPEVGRQTARWLGRRPTRTQQAELDVALERIDGPGSPFAFDQVVIIKGRRCGKTVTTFGVPLVRSLAGPVHLPNGRTVPFHAVHIAQNLTAARTRFGEDLVDQYRTRFDELTWKRGIEHRRGAADTVLLLDPRRRKDLEDAKRRQLASELRVLAPTPSSARGAGVLHRTYDEALTFTKERGDMLEAAGRPTMAEMHGLAQTWWVSNISEQTDATTALWHLRNRGRAAVAEGRNAGICYIEYSLPPGEDWRDEANWWRYYPALGEGIVGIRELRRELEEFTEQGHPEAFAAEYLTRWPDENPVRSTGWEVIDRQKWEAAATDEEIPASAAASIAVHLDPLGRTASIVSAAVDESTPDGVILEVLADGPGSDWAIEEALKFVDGVEAVGADDHGGGKGLIERFGRMPVVADKLVRVQSADLSAACFDIDARIRDGRLKWRNNEHGDTLTRAAAAAERAGGASWYWDQRVTPSQSTLVAATLAVWALEHRPAPVPDSAIYI